MAEVTVASSQTRNPGAGARTWRPRENATCLIYFLTAIDSTDTFTPFPASTGFPRSIIDWAIKPVAAGDAPVSQTTYSTIPVNTGSGAEEMSVVYTPPTSTAAGFFTFNCTVGSGNCYFYLWVM